MKNTDQSRILKMLKGKHSLCSFEKGCKFIQVEMGDQIKTQNGYQKQEVNFVFDDKGNLEKISISVRDFALMETERSGDVISSKII